MKNELAKVAEYAKRHGYKVLIVKDHVIATNENGSIRTGSLETMKKVCAK